MATPLFRGELRRFAAGVDRRIRQRIAGAGSMNKLEARFYDEMLAPGAGKLGALFCRVEYEGVKLRLGDRCWYTPDFVCWPADQRSGLLAFEVKGFWRDDARVKIKTAAQRYEGSIDFTAATWGARAGWKLEVIRPR